MTNLYFAGNPSVTPPGFTIEELAIQHVARKYGMFYHFGMATYGRFDFGDPDTDPDVFAPTELSFAQWMDVAQDAGANYVVSVMKHHDGFTQWDSAVQPHNVTQSTGFAGRNLLSEFYEEAESRDLPNLHYISIRDDRWEQDNPGYTSEQFTQYTMDIMTEMYEQAPNMFAFWADAWGFSNPAGGVYFDWVDFETVREHVRSLRSDLLLFVNDNGNLTLEHSDISVWELGSVGYPPPTNILPTESCMTAMSSWFRHEDWPAESYVGVGPGHGVLVPTIAAQVWAGNSAYLLNVPPSQNGLIDQDLIDAIQFVNTD